jgi:hypothetical protein
MTTTPLARVFPAPIDLTLRSGAQGASQDEVILLKRNSL